MDSLQCERLWLPNGGLGHFDEWMAKRAWAESPLLQKAHKSPQDFWELCTLFHAGNPQVQLSIHDEDSYGECVGGLALMETFDGQVGPALVAVHTWLHPNYRGSLTLQRTLRKMALQECRNQGCRWLILTRQMPDGSNRTTYKEVT